MYVIFLKRTTVHVILTYAFIGKFFSTCTLSFEKLSLRLIIREMGHIIGH